MDKITRIDRSKYDLKGPRTNRVAFFSDLSNFQAKGNRHRRAAKLALFMLSFDSLVVLILLLTGQVWWLWTAGIAIGIMFLTRFVSEGRTLVAYTEAVTEDMCWFFDETGQPEKKREYLERLQ